MIRADKLSSQRYLNTVLQFVEEDKTTACKELGEIGRPSVVSLALLLNGKPMFLCLQRYFMFQFMKDVSRIIVSKCVLVSLVLYRLHLVF